MSTFANRSWSEYSVPSANCREDWSDTRQTLTQSQSRASLVRVFETCQTSVLDHTIAGDETGPQLCSQIHIVLPLEL